MPSKKISRRAVLKGMAGGALATVALPALEIMLNRHGDAHSDGSALPSRFVTFFFGNGVLWDRWIPSAQGADYALTEQLAPLINVKQHCAVITGTENKIEPKITHHEGASGMLSGHPFISPGGVLFSKFGGPSIDQVVADRIGNDTFLGSVQVGVSKRVSTDEGPTMQFISHRGPDQPLPPEYNPVLLWNRLFGSFVPPEDPSGGLRIRALDAVRDDASRLRKLLGAADRERLDAHLTSVESLQQQIAALPPVCNMPATPTVTNTDAGGVEPMPAVARAMSDLLVYAFRCDLTRVASYMLTGGVGFTLYSHLGHSIEQHFMSHDPTTYGDELSASIVWNMGEFAYLIEQMLAASEGASSVLANSVVVLGSDCGEGWSHTTYDQPIVVAGHGAGRLRTGFHLRTPNARNTSDVLLAAARAACPEIESVGSEEGFSANPMTELLI